MGRDSCLGSGVVASPKMGGAGTLRSYGRAWGPEGTAQGRVAATHALSPHLGGCERLLPQWSGSQAHLSSVGGGRLGMDKHHFFMCVRVWGKGLQSTWKRGHCKYVDMSGDVGPVCV